MKPAIGFVTSSSGVAPSAFWPPGDDSSEFEVEDILHSCFVLRGRKLVEEFLVKWRGYDFFKAIWEPLANLTNCLTVLSSFC